jgi:hypothetical protein
MTRSSRQANRANAAAHNLELSKDRCRECDGELLRTTGATHICTRCGLVQEVEKKEIEP